MAKRKRQATKSQSNSPSPQAGDETGKRIKRGTSLVDETNALDSVSFVEKYFSQEHRHHSRGSDHSNITLTFAGDLTTVQLNQCFDLIESTSRQDYEPSSFGWHPARKRREMKEEEMRYLQVYKESEGQHEEFEGFLSFMITHDSSPVVPVLYIYEIHLTEGARGKGLGCFLMGIAESIAHKIGVEKVMLTCFLSNTIARNFYDRLGYRTDACSPEDRTTRKKVVKVDYVIMSKGVFSEVSAEDEPDSGLEVSQHDSSSLDEDDADDYPSLEDAPRYLRAWIEMQRQKELLNSAIRAAKRAKQELSNGDNDPGSRSRSLLDSYFQCLRQRFEAARDWEDIVREQMYHVKSLISDVNRMGETLGAVQSIKQEFSASPPSIPEEESFDMEKATGQVYAAFYTMVRKAEEIDDRLDSIAEREQEADALEQDLDDREEELDSWENDLQAREKAMAEREDRLARSRQRLKRRRSDRKGVQQAPLESQEEEESWEGERVRALPWHQESPPRDIVGSWLRQNAVITEAGIHDGSPPSIAVDEDD